MNNEEKILSILEKMDTRLNSMDTRLSKLETEVSSIRGTVTLIEQEHGKKLDALFDGHKQLDAMVARIEDHVSAQDEVILKRVFPETLK